jgi:uncharacterized protein YjdB
MRHDIVGLSLKPADAALKVGAALQLNLFAETKSGAQDLVPGNMATWSSSDDRVAEVSRQGRVTPRAAGVVTVTVAHGDRKVSAFFIVSD